MIRTTTNKNLSLFTATSSLSGIKNVVAYQRSIRPCQQATLYLLTQLHTGPNWFSSRRKHVGYSEDDPCVYGSQETVTHTLVWTARTTKEPRKELRNG